MGKIENQKKIEVDANLAMALRFYQDGNWQKAGEIYQEILDRYPNHPDALHQAGMLAYETGDNQCAVEQIRKAIAIRPLDAALYHHLGRVLEELGKFDEAVNCYRQTLKIQPDYADAYNDMGLLFRDQGKIAEALSNLQKAVEVGPECVEAHHNLGNLLQDGGRLEAASECYRQALAIQPDFAKAINNLGMAYQGMGKSEEAVACFHQAIEIQPDYASAYRHLVYQLQKDCSWSAMETPAARLDQLTKLSLNAGVRPAEDPFLNLSRHANPSYNFVIAKAWSSEVSRRVAAVSKSFAFDNRRDSARPIRIGYLSNNFHDHPMAHLLLGLFGLHDRKRFKPFCYSCGREDESHYRQRIRQDCDKFVDLRSMSHLEAAQAIYNDRIDILVDLMGHTKGSRMEICALRPAPVQVRYLGLAGTSGANFFDYIITDKIVTPKTQAPYYSENFAYLPHCYQVNDYRQANAEDIATAAEPELPTDRFVFSSFNQDYKLDPVMFDCWMQILRRVPDSILWLMVRHKSAVENLRVEAQKKRRQTGSTGLCGKTVQVGTSGTFKKGGPGIGYPGGQRCCNHQ